MSKIVLVLLLSMFVLAAGCTEAQSGATDYEINSLGSEVAGSGNDLQVVSDADFIDVGDVQNDFGS